MFLPGAFQGTWLKPAGEPIDNLKRPASEAEAHYLCGLLSSAVLTYQIEGQSVRGGKSFGSPGMLAGLRLPRYRPGDAVHEALVDGSRAAFRGDYAAPSVAIGLGAAAVLAALGLAIAARTFARESA